MLGDITLLGVIAERPAAAADLLQRCCGGPAWALPRAGRQCLGRRAVAAVSMLGEAMGTSAEKFIAQHLPGSVVLSVCPGKRKSFGKHGSER